MTAVTIIGAGRIGASIAKLLLPHPEFEITLVDSDPNALARLPPPLKERSTQLDLKTPSCLKPLLATQEVVVSALTFTANPMVAEAALASNCSYFDLTEDVSCTKRIEELASFAKPGQVFMPQCGLAPGFIGILGADMISRFDSVDTLKMRVGAIPEFPSNRIMYNLTWSTEGLINEYCHPCEALVNGHYQEIQPLEGREQFSLDGVEYEAFNTSGGLGTLGRTMTGKVRNMTYKTVRYPGHCNLMRFLLHDLQLGNDAEQRALLSQIFERAVAVTWQDLVLVMVSASGYRDGQLLQETEVFKLYHQDVGDEHWSAIQVSTASSLCVILDLFRQDKLPDRGFIRQEQVRLSDFFASSFAASYLHSHQTGPWSP